MASWQTFPFDNAPLSHSETSLSRTALGCTVVLRSTILQKSGNKVAWLQSRKDTNCQPVERKRSQREEQAGQKVRETRRKWEMGRDGAEMDERVKVERGIF